MRTQLKYLLRGTWLSLSKIKMAIRMELRQISCSALYVSRPYSTLTPAILVSALCLTDPQERLSGVLNPSQHLHSLPSALNCSNNLENYVTNPYVQ